MPSPTGGAQWVLAVLLVAQICLGAHRAVSTDPAFQSMDRPRSLLDDATNPLSPRWSPTRARTYTAAEQQLQQQQRLRKPATPKKLQAASPRSIEDPRPVPGETRLVQLAFMHRHGARTAPQVHGSVLSWDQCHLSGPGAGMAVNLGRNLRQWYPSFIPTVYDRNHVVSTSTDVERTIRTGYGVLSGLFPRNTSDGAATANNFSLPLLHHVPMMQDPRLGYYYSWPAALLHQPQLLTYNLDSAAATRSYLTPADLASAGDLTGAQQICSNASLATTCALFAEDVGTCRNSNQGITQAYRDLLTPGKLLHAQALSNYFIYGPNASRPFDRAIGPYGMQIITDILDQFGAALEQLRHEPDNSTKAATPRVYHYSAHDITVYGFLVAMGVIDAATTDIHLLVPTFTSIVRLELYSNATVSFLFSYCDQAFGTQHDYHTVPAAVINCMDATGNVYKAGNCRLGDFRRFIHQKLNVSNEAYPPCYADPQDVLETKCAPWRNTSLATVDDPSLTDMERAYAGYCMTYRKACPVQACDVNQVQEPNDSGPANAKYAIDTATLKCERVYSMEAKTPVPAAWVVCLFFGMGCFTTCALLTVAVFYCIAKAGRPDAPMTESESLIRDEAGLASGGENGKASLNENQSNLYA